MASPQTIRLPASGPPPEAQSRRLGRWERTLFVCLLVASVVLLAFAVAGTPRAHADSVAYLIEVTVRPGYDFANAEAALGYGYQLCDRVSAGRGYGDLIGDVKADFQTGDEFQASYLIDKAVNELCPAQIWQLRNSAAHYQPAAE
jgi:hypothetical protein